MTTDNLYPNALKAGKSLRGWDPKNPYPIRAQTSMVIVEGKPLVKVTYKNGPDAIYTVDELWKLESTLTVENGLPTQVMKKITEYRARKSQDLILKIWNQQGYKAKDYFGKKPSELINAPTLATLIPVSKDTGKSLNTNKAHYSAILTFTAEGPNAYWTLTINEDKSKIQKILWDDTASLSELARVTLDPDYVGALLILTDSKANDRLIASQAKESKEKVTQRYFREAIFSTQQRVGAAMAHHAYHVALSEVLRDAYAKLPMPKGGMHVSHSLYNYEDGLVGFHRGETIKVMALDSIMIIDDGSRVYSKLPSNLMHRITRAEEKLWKAYKETIKGLELTIIEEYNHLAKPRIKGKFVFHSFIVVKDEAKYREFVLNNKNNQTLFSYAESQLEKKKPKITKAL